MFAQNINIKFGEEVIRAFFVLCCLFSLSFLSLTEAKTYHYKSVAVKKGTVDAFGHNYGDWVETSQFTILIGVDEYDNMSDVAVGTGKEINWQFFENLSTWSLTSVKDKGNLKTGGTFTEWYANSDNNNRCIVRFIIDGKNQKYVYIENPHTGKSMGFVLNFIELWDDSY